MSRRQVAAFLLLAALLAPSMSCSRSACGGQPPKVIILGFDGMDYELTSQMIREGRLPHFARLAATGAFSPLGTSIPPQSPVAWSDFITGTDSGGHGIFDFIHRDPKTMQPYLSTSRAEGSGLNLEVGKWRIPLSGGTVELLRHGEAFWTVLEEHGVETTIVRIPANFPPSGTATRELSGMGTPDILGTYGTFSFYTTDPFRSTNVTGGEVFLVELRDGQLHTRLYGPDNPFLREPTRLSTELVVFADPEANAAKLVVSGTELVLGAGEWSDWVSIAFAMAPTKALPAIARFYLRSVSPELELYVSPLNIDPTNPAMPISTPKSWAGYLCSCTGYFYTQGMPEDTKAVTENVLTVDEFLEQAALAGEESIAQLSQVLGEFRQGLLFYYFGNTDLVSHIMWRSLDPSHPAYDPVRDPKYAEVIPRLYQRMDEVVGMTLERMPEGTLLIVMSDHGFSSWRRAVNLNTWLKEEGYLAVKDPNAAGEAYSNVDWSRTSAYGLGLNGLYINLKGREASGIVEPRDRQALIDEIADKLSKLVDPTTGKAAVAKVYQRDETYTDGGFRDIGPDIQVGYAKGTRGSNESALGEILPTVFMDNTERWTGDHCMDHESVPGILLTSRPLHRPGTELKNLAAAVLAELGIDEFPRAHQQRP